MSDKDVTRSVRSSGKEGIQTPTQKHFHSLSEKDNLTFGEKNVENNEKDKLLQKFKNREKAWKTVKNPEKNKQPDKNMEKE